MVAMLNYQDAQKQLINSPRNWLVTGAAGFIGSNLCHKLLQLKQSVVGIDNFSNGQDRNIRELISTYPEFEFIEGDIRDLDLVQKLVKSKHHILHQAALGSVPRSIEFPLKSHDSNVNGTLNILYACKDAKVPVVFASSSSVYGDSPILPKVEDKVGAPLSPYAATKTVAELYAKVFSHTYNLHVTGLRYFNVFGPRQLPGGPYAAVIPKWINQMLKGEDIEIFGDGETSRDFCFIENAVQANIMAAFHGSENKSGEIYNIAAKKQTTLSQLFSNLASNYMELHPEAKVPKVHYRGFRPGDVRHSLADIAKAQKNLGYQPTHSVEQGLEISFRWFKENSK